MRYSASGFNNKNQFLKHSLNGDKIRIQRFEMKMQKKWCKKEIKSEKGRKEATEKSMLINLFHWSAEELFISNKFISMLSLTTFLLID